MSSSQTNNYGLHQWSRTDYVEVNEFNENFGKIDEEVAKKASQADMENVIAQLEDKPSRQFVEQYAVNVASFGADSSSSDNSNSFMRAISHIKNVLGGSGKLTLPAGKRFRFTKPIGSFEISDLTIDFNGAVLDFSNVPASSTDTVLHFIGSIDPATALTADSPENSKIIKCNTGGLQAGDMVKVYSNKVWDSTNTSTRIGEIHFIEKIDSEGQLTLTKTLEVSYNTADTAMIAKINPCRNINLMNGKFIGAAGNNEMRGVRITRGADCYIQNIKTEGFDVNHIQLTDCVRCIVENHFSNEANHSSMGYGVSFADASCDCIATGCYYTDVRHSFSTNNNVSTSWGIVRRITFNNCIISDSAPALGGTGGDGVDTHAGAEDIRFNNLTVISSSGIGINIEANRATINGVFVKGTASVGIRFAPYADGRKSSLTVMGAQLSQIGDSVGSDYGILANLTVADCESLIINGCDVVSQNTGIRLASSNGYKFKRASLANNNIKVTASGYGVETNNVDNLSLVGGSIDAPNFGVGLNNTNNSTVNGTSISLTGTASAGYGIRLLGTSKRNAISGNAIRNVALTNASTTGVKIDDTATYNGVFGNVTENMPAGAAVVGTGAGNLQASNI